MKRSILAAAATVAALGWAIGGLADTPAPSPSPPSPTPTAAAVQLGGPGRARVELPAPARAIANDQARELAAGDDLAAHADLRDGPTSPAIARSNEREAPAGAPVIPRTVPAAAPTVPGCRTLLVRNFSSRNGAPILLFVFHYTVSADSGWNGVLANVKWFDTAAASASSTYIADRRTGACALTVAETSKAWAQAAYNPWALSLEVTATGREGSYLPAGAGRQRVLALMHRAHAIYRLPYVHGAVAGGRVTRPGFVTHADLGQLGGGHHDVEPYGIDDLIAEAAATDPSARRITSVDRVTCRKLNWWREHGRKHGAPEANAIRRRDALARRHVRCTSAGPELA
jgi:hypothetical protein